MVEVVQMVNELNCFSWKRCTTGSIASTAQTAGYSLVWWNWSTSQMNKNSSTAQIAQSFLNGWSSPNGQISSTGSTSISSLIGLNAQASLKWSNWLTWLNQKKCISTLNRSTGWIFKQRKAVKLQYLSQLVDKVQIAQTSFKWFKKTEHISSFTGSPG